MTVQPVSGRLTDHYDPRTKTLRLSQAVYDQTSVAAIGVAAHECGHAIQDYKEYVPLKLRGAIVPVVNIGQQISWPLILIGMLFGGLGSPLVEIGILCFSFAVEFNASSRALKLLDSTGILAEDELGMTRKVLGAAAMTYVAGAISSILQLLRLVILFGGRRDDD